MEKKKNARRNEFPVPRGPRFYRLPVGNDTGTMEKSITIRSRGNKSSEDTTARQDGIYPRFMNSLGSARVLDISFESQSIRVSYLPRTGIALTRKRGWPFCVRFSVVSIFESRAR